MFIKNKIALVVAIVLIAAGAGVYLWLQNSSEDPAVQQTAEQQELDQQLHKACQIFDIETARTLLGQEAAVLEKESSDGSSFSEDIAASKCMYTDRSRGENASPESEKIATFIIRTPRSENGRKANEAVFSTGSLPAGSESMESIGDSAFWNAEFGQLNILKSGNWYILEYGSSMPSNRSQGDTLKFADIISGKI